MGDIPPRKSRMCRIGCHAYCGGDGCYCDCHVPAELLEIADEAFDPFPERADPAADLEQALACLYALEERAHRALAQCASNPDSLRKALAEIRDVARTCVAGIDGD